MWSKTWPCKAACLQQLAVLRHASRACLSMRLASEMLIHGWQSKACQEAANNISCEPIMGCITCTLRAACSTSYQGKWCGVISMWTDGLVHELQTVHSLHFRRCWQHPTWLRLASDMFAQCWCCKACMRRRCVSQLGRNLHLESCLQQLKALRLASKAIMFMACRTQDVVVSHLFLDGSAIPRQGLQIILSHAIIEKHKQQITNMRDCVTTACLNTRV